MKSTGPFIPDPRSNNHAHSSPDTSLDDRGFRLFPGSLRQGFARSPTVRIATGAKYCHEAALTGTWTVDAQTDETTRDDFRDGSGELEYRVAGPDSILVSFYVKKYEGLTVSRVYSSKKILMPLRGAGTAGEATEAQWQAAGLPVGSRTPLFSDPPTAAPWPNRVALFHGFEFAARGGSGPPLFVASPGGDWIAALGFEGVFPGAYEFGQSHGSMYFDVYRVASGDNALQIQLDFRGTEPGQFLPHAVWISDRHFLFPVNRLKTQLMVCDLSPLQKGSEPALERPSKNSEILGFHEETTTNDVAGTLNQLTLRVGVRVPEDGKYRLSATVENERGVMASRAQDADLMAGINQIPYGVDPPRDTDGRLKIRKVRLEKITGGTGDEVARRDFLGTIGPYKLILPDIGLRRKSLDALKQMNAPPRVPGLPVVVPSPLTMRSLPGPIEVLTQTPKAGDKIDAMRLSVGVPPVTGHCTWIASVASGGRTVLMGSTIIDSQTPPKAVVLEFPAKSMVSEVQDGELRLSAVQVVCHDEKSTWVHSFDQFPGYTIPGLRVSMLEHGTAPSATFTGVNRVELLDTNHEVIYDAIKVNVGFFSDRK